jgi:hypothetical protein
VISVFPVLCICSLQECNSSSVMSHVPIHARYIIQISDSRVSALASDQYLYFCVHFLNYTLQMYILHPHQLTGIWSQKVIKIQSYCHLLAIHKNYFWWMATNSWLNTESLVAYAAFWAGWITQFQNILTLYYSQDHWLSGLCPLSHVLKECNILETRPGPVNDISSV